MEKIKKDPIRCLKCQGWNHHAHECVSVADKCGNCAEGHRTSQCPTPHHRKCVSCNTDDHASWSRHCPTYIRKREECNSRNPKNSLQFFPTSEPWTWTPKSNEMGDKRRSDSYRPNKRAHDIYIPRSDRYGLGPLLDWDTPLPPPQPHGTMRRRTTESS